MKAKEFDKVCTEQCIGRDMRTNTCKTCLVRLREVQKE